MTQKERHLAALRRAYAVLHRTLPDGALCRLSAAASYAEVRSVVRAVLPGRQTAQNTADAMDKAVRAVTRVIRRRAK